MKNVKLDVETIGCPSVEDLSATEQAVFCKVLLDLLLKETNTPTDWGSQGNMVAHLKQKTMNKKVAEPLANQMKLGGWLK